MKAKSTFFFFLFSIISFSVFAQSADVTEGCAPLQVKFQAPDGFSTYFWDFKDGATSILQNPVRNFIQAGIYLVEFRESENGPIIGTVEINVYPKPDLDIAADNQAGCLPLNVNFSDNSSIDPAITVTNYTWVFGDGNSDNGINVNHLYDEAGVYTVSLSIETNFESCNVDEVYLDYIEASNGPSAAFTTDPNPPVACQGPLVINFTNETQGAGNTYVWEFGNGNGSNLADPPAETYGIGNFVATLTATDPLGCESSTSVDIKVGNPTSFFTLPDTICSGDTVTIQNLSGPGIYAWDFGPNAIPTTSTVENPTVIFTEEGDQDISLTVTAGTCTGESTLSTYVDAVDVDFTAVPDTSCESPFTVDFMAMSQDAISYFWEFGDDSTSMEENPQHEYVNPDTTIYSINGTLIFTPSLTVTSSSQCTATLTDTIVLQQPNALFYPDIVQGCAPLTVMFADSSTSVDSIIQWEFFFGDDSTGVFTNTDSISYTYTQPGTYPVQLVITNNKLCTDTSYTVIIEVGDTLALDFSVDETEICPGDSVTFIPSDPGVDVDAWHFNTDDGRSFHCYQDSSLTWPFITEPGVYPASLTVEYNGCFSTITKDSLITVNGPIADIDYEIECGNPFDVIFRDSSKGTTLTLWDFGDSTTSQIAGVHTYDTTGDYTVILRAFPTQSNCPVSLDTVTVHIRDPKASIELDTALCDGVTYDLDATASIDVQSSCWKGYTWFFAKNGRPITTQDSVIQKTFTVPGPDTVSLEVTDINGCRDTMDLPVVIYQVDAQISADDSTICLPSNVTFDTTGSTALFSDIVGIFWDYGDGSPLDTGIANPTHLYDDVNSNPIIVSLTLQESSAAACVNTTTLPISIYSPESFISTIPNPAELCVGEEFTFTGSDFTSQGSNLDFLWDFGDDSNDENGQMVTHAYDEGGNYIVQLVFEEIATGCTDSVSTTVTVQEPPVAAFDSNLDDLVALCAPIASAQFTDISTGSDPVQTVSWDFGNGQTAPGTPGSTISTSYPDTGTYVVTMVVETAFGCIDSVSQVYEVVAPSGNFGINQNNICKFDSITFTLVDTFDVNSWEWDFGDGTVVSDENPVTHQYTNVPPSGQTVASLILTNSVGCEVTLTQDIIFEVVVADFFFENFDPNFCIDETFQLNNGSDNANSYSWTFSDGGVSIEQNPEYSFDTVGTYLITLAALNLNSGCSDTISKNAVVLPPPQPIAIGDTICENNAGANLSIGNPSANSTYIWGPSELVVVDTSQISSSVPLEEPVVFTVTEIDVNGCIGSGQTDSILLIPDFVGPSAIDTFACPDVPFSLPIQRTENYELAVIPAEVFVSFDGNVPVVQVNESQTIEVQPIELFPAGCNPAPIPVEIEVPNEDIRIPDIFTPNGDGTNDRFNIIPVVTNADLDVRRFQVFNRFGQTVYENDDPTDGWDGTIDGKEAPADAYIYIIEASIEGCPIRAFNGEVMLLR